MGVDKNCATKPDSSPRYSREELNSLFWRYDKNEDCRLGWKKLKEAFKELGALFPAYTAYRALHFADENGDGYISEDEMDNLIHYAEKLNCRKPYTKETLGHLILLFDFDGDGRLCKQELKRLVAALGAPFPSYRANRALHYADQNRDGYISEEELDKLADYLWKVGYKIKYS